MPIKDMLEEPAEVTNALPIPRALQVRKLIREIMKDNVPFIKFFKLSRDDTPAYTQWLPIQKRSSSLQAPR